MVAVIAVGVTVTLGTATPASLTVRALPGVSDRFVVAGIARPAARVAASPTSASAATATSAAGRVDNTTATAAITAIGATSTATAAQDAGAAAGTTSDQPSDCTPIKVLDGHDASRFLSVNSFAEAGAAATEFKPIP